MKVLLIGNDAKQQKIIQDCLGKDDYEVLVDKKGDKSLDLINEESPELVIADYDIPGGGINLINNILILPETSFPYILFIIKEEDEQSVISSLGPIPGDFIFKPVNENELQARIAVAEKAIALSHPFIGATQEMCPVRHMTPGSPLTGEIGAEKQAILPPIPTGYIGSIVSGKIFFFFGCPHQWVLLQ